MSHGRGIARIQDTSSSPSDRIKRLASLRLNDIAPGEILHRATSYRGASFPAVPVRSDIQVSHHSDWVADLSLSSPKLVAKYMWRPEHAFLALVFVHFRCALGIQFSKTHVSQDDRDS